MRGYLQETFPKRAVEVLVASLPVPVMGFGGRGGERKTEKESISELDSCRERDKRQRERLYN